MSRAWDSHNQHDAWIGGPGGLVSSHLVSSRLVSSGVVSLSQTSWAALSSGTFGGKRIWDMPFQGHVRALITESEKEYLAG